MRRIRKSARFIAAFLLLQFSTQIFLPSVSYALTSGPSQPEFSSFEPVSSSNMVDEFTGDFTYNLPLLEVPGPHGGSYPLSLSYHSGVTPEEEASWVGYGWTLNAGAINRNVRGIPDDSKGDEVINYNKTPQNWTATLGASVFIELFSKDAGMFTPSINATYRYNNYRGFGLVKGAGLILGRGLINMGYTVDEGTGSFSLSVNPMSLLKKPQEVGKKETEKTKDKEYTAKDAFKSYARSKAMTTMNTLTSYNLGSKYGIYTYNQATVMPTYVSAYTGASFNITGTFNIDPSQFEFGGGFNVMGSYTWQKNAPSTLVPSYGYMYSSLATGQHMMDFHYEKDNPYDKQDEFIGIPFNDVDQYTVTGEGIGGGFRMFTPTVGQFGPTEVTSKSDIVQVGVEFEAGLNWGGGVDIGLGRHSFKITDWNRTDTGYPNNTFPTFGSAVIDEPAFFRFNNDPGGAWGDKYDDMPVRYGTKTSSGVLLPATQLDLAINNKVRGGRSSYIGFHTNDQIDKDLQKMRTYSKRNWNSFVTRSQNADDIGELSVTNADGMRYVYGLPVYSKEESNLNFGLEKVAPSDIESNAISYKKRDAEMKVGQVRKAPYAYSYLLTEILTRDYIDKPVYDGTTTAPPDGPTPDDLGGYVRFGYHKIYGDLSQNSSWFRWRIPYNGVAYQRNSLSDKRDDMGTLASGQKEIYYLKTVETKSHVALFYFSDRSDGLGALDDEAAMPKSAAPSTNKLKQLDKIELYALSAMGIVARDVAGNIQPPSASVKPIKTVYFQYAPAGSELMTGAPNATASTRGRLTLQKIYFEYNGVVQAKLSPYQFEYKYPTTSYPGGTVTNYTAFENLSSKFIGYNAETENPKYSPFNIDAWGNYQPNGASQYASMRTWINQKVKPNIDFDPAAWNLKKIILPSGGEIHVQYEQDDYQYVQDQDAHIMAPLLDPQPVGTGVGLYKFYIDLDKIGISPSDVTRKDMLKKLILDRYVSQASKKKMYFKFLYTLKGSSVPTLASCNAEYMTGYARVVNANYDAAATNSFYIEFDVTNLPRQVCSDFVFANVIGRVNESTVCDRSAEMMPEANDGGDKSKALAILRAFFDATSSALGAGSLLPPNTYCVAPVNNQLSYLRVPTVNPKKGGGLRVKRLLMYDNSVDGPVLYGNSYDYSTKLSNGVVVSNGVAANEPSSNREENILVEYIPKKRQTLGNRIVAGKDKEVSEGPLGETVYPGPTVGYSKVTVTNIYAGKTNPGFSVTEFFTARDYPVKVAKTEIHGNSKLKFKLGIFGNKLINNKTAVQGFSIVLNNMHGQMKRTASYAGDYLTGVDLTKSTLVSEQVYDYYLPGETIPVMSGLYGSVTPKKLGREVDFTLAQRSIVESSIDGNTEIDLTAGIFALFVLPFFNLMGSITKADANLSTHVTTKVVRYPAIVKKITTYQDGIYHSDEYVAFDELSGKPIAVKSEDEFKGAYLKQSIPAAWEFPNYAQRATNENKIVVTAGSPVGVMYPPVNGKYPLYLSGTNACTALSQLAVGDLLKLATSYSNTIFRVESIDYGGDAAMLVSTRYNNPANILSSPTSVYQFEILESGYNNQLNENAGNIVFHDPVKDNVDPSDFTDAARYSSNAFTTALGTFYNGTGTTTTLAGSYTNMNMAAFSSYAPTCSVDWTNATVRNLSFSKVAGANSITLILTSFDIQCTSGWITITR